MLDGENDYLNNNVTLCMCVYTHILGTYTEWLVDVKIYNGRVNFFVSKVRV